MTSHCVSVPFALCVCAGGVFVLYSILISEWTVQLIIISFLAAADGSSQDDSRKCLQRLTVIVGMFSLRHWAFAVVYAVAFAPPMRCLKQCFKTCDLFSII
jgi:hypothetical protein